MMHTTDIQAPTQSLQQVTLQHTDKRKVVLWVFPTTKPMQKNSVVFIPGTGGYTGTYLQFINTLAGEYNVVSVDPTGHGLTAHANGEGTRGKFTGQQLVEDTVLATKWSQNHFKGDVGLLGTSQGGEIAARTMVREPLVKASILQGVFDTAVSGGVNFKQRMAKMLPLFLVKTFLGATLDLRKQLDWDDLYKGAGFGSSFTKSFNKKFGRAPTSEERNAAVTNAVHERFADPLSLGHYDTESYQSLLRYDWTASSGGARDPMATYQGPVMVITGEKDHTITPAFIKKIGERLTSPQKEVVVIPGGYHQLPLHNTDEFMAVAIPFLGRHLGAPRDPSP